MISIFCKFRLVRVDDLKGSEGGKNTAQARFYVTGLNKKWYCFRATRAMSEQG